MVVTTVNHISKATNKCWLCQTSDHWVDQCQRLISMSPKDRLKAMKDNHACFNMTTCSRQRQCSEKYNGIPCTMFHHPRLHKNINQSVSASSVGVASVKSGEALGYLDIRMYAYSGMCYSTLELK